MTVLGGTHSYTLHWNGTVPNEITIHGSGVEKYVTMLLATLDAN